VAKILLGDNIDSVAVMLLTVTFQCDGFWTSTVFPCMHIYSWPRVYINQTCAKLDLLQNFGKNPVAPCRPPSVL